MPIRISGSTGISGLDGSATTPVLQGASANSGIHYSGNTVFVSTSGTKALTIGPTGNVAFTNTNVSIGGQTISAYSGMMKNRIINGDFKIDQRFGGAANNGVNQYIVDRWIGLTMTLARTRFQQNNTNGPGSSATQTATGFVNYFGANVVSSNASFGASDQYLIYQPIEGLNTADLGWGTANASPVTLSFWAYSSIPGTHSGVISNGPGGRSYPFTYGINTANTWQYQTITIPGETSGNWFSNNNVGMYVAYNFGSGTNYASSSGNAWQTSFYQTVTGAIQPQSYANGSLYLTGVQLEKGSQATPFEFRHYTTELQLCQRYYQVYGGNGLFLIGGYGATGGDIYNMFSFPVQMRVSPTVSSLGSWSTNNTNTPYPKITRISSYGFCVYATIVTTGSWYVDGNSSSTLITASSELGVQN